MIQQTVAASSPACVRHERTRAVIMTMVRPCPPFMTGPFRTGPIPEELGDLVAIRQIDFANNRLSGEDGVSLRYGFLCRNRHANVMKRSATTIGEQSEKLTPMKKRTES